MSNIILKITRLSTRTTGSYIMNILKKQEVCEVSRIVMSRYYIGNRQFKRAIIHVSFIEDNIPAYNLFKRLYKTGHAKIVHADPHYWNIYLQPARKIEE